MHQATQLSQARQQALADAREHVRLTAIRLQLADRMLDNPNGRLELDEPDNLSIAAASLEQALECLAVAFEECDRARYLP